jgi:hypothetical protein
MKYMKKRRSDGDEGFVDDDPLSGVANLFDVGLVFIVALLVMLFSAYHLQDLFDQNSDMTIMKKTADESLEIITKKGVKIEAMKVSKSKAKGRGERLGTAYKLEDGTMVYIPQ